MPTLELYGSFLSPCCKAKMRIIRSREGGFVTQNCIDCSTPRAITIQELPRLRCSACDVDLIVFQRTNYVYQCPKCKHEWELPDLIPPWFEVFPEYGYYLDSDG